MRRRVAVFVLLSALPLGIDAHADEQPAPAESRADVLLEEGARLFAEEADYVAALARLEESHRLRPSWRALNGIALVYQQQGRFVRALETYEQLLFQYSAELSERQRANVSRRVEVLRRRVAVIRLTAEQADVHLLLDGRAIGRSPMRATMRVLPGEHTIVASREGHETRTYRMHLAAAALKSVTVHLERIPVKVVVEKPVARIERRVPAWTPLAAGATGVALLMGGAGLAASSQNDLEEFDRRVAAASGEQLAAVVVDDALVASGRRKRTASRVLAGAGAAAVVGALVLWLINEPRTIYEDSPTQPMHAPGGTAISWSVRF